jgi:hypothetical protein
LKDQAGLESPLLGNLAMATLIKRYSEDDERTLRILIFPEEDRGFFTRERWTGGFRWYRAPNVVCLEHYRPAPPITTNHQATKPAA